MFSCTTKFTCDICGTGYISTGNRMTDCTSKGWFRYIHRSEGWKTVYGKYDICPDCVKHYGMKNIRNKLKKGEKALKERVNNEQV